MLRPKVQSPSKKDSRERKAWRCVDAFHDGARSRLVAAWSHQSRRRDADSPYSLDELPTFYHVYPSAFVRGHLPKLLRNIAASSSDRADSITHSLKAGRFALQPYANE